MKTKLDQLTLEQFIDLTCGEVGVLLGAKEIPNPAKLATAMRNIVMEYRAIADPSGNSAYLRAVGDLVRSKLEIMLFTMCFNLATIGRHDLAKQVLADYGLNAAKWAESRVEGTITAKLEQAKRQMADLEKQSKQGDTSAEAIRRDFGGLVAALMAHFRFQIDPATIKASLFAHLVARHNHDIKAQLAAAKSKKVI